MPVRITIFMKSTVPLKSFLFLLLTCFGESQATITSILMDLSYDLQTLVLTVPAPVQ